jgi:PEP-CTERM motif
MNQRRVLGAMAVSVVVGWATMIGPAPARAGFLTESPTSTGTLYASQTESQDPTYTLTLGGPYLNSFLEGRYGGFYNDSALKFDLTSLPPNIRITSATFNFTVASSDQAMFEAPSLDVGGIGSSSPTVTLPDFFSSRTSLGSTGPLPGYPLGPVNETFNLDVTGFVQSLVNGGVSNVEFLTSEPVLGNATIYGDSTNGASYAPSLSITFGAVPEPSSLVLCGLAGLIGLAVSRVRRKRAA